MVLKIQNTQNGPVLEKMIVVGILKEECLMKLSILICSHVNRRPLLERMLKHLREQSVNGVEVCVAHNDNISKRGRDRNSLIDGAQGDYCAFVDDDDVVSDDYVWRILKAIEGKPDICSLTGRVTSLVDGMSRKFMLSTVYDKVFSLPSDEVTLIAGNPVYYRFASHINPIRREIVRSVRFPEDILHEDNGYSERLRQFIKQHIPHIQENLTGGVIYQYFSRIRIGKA